MYADYGAWGWVILLVGLVLCLFVSFIMFGVGAAIAVAMGEILVVLRVAGFEFFKRGVTIRKIDVE